MGIRTSYNAPLGVPAFGVAHSTAAIALGTIVRGYDDVANRENEYVFLQSPAAIVAGDDVDFDANFLATEVAAGTGGAVAIGTSGAGEYAWFRLRARPQA